MIIYSATNLINNKKYIGKTCFNLSRRKTEHIYRSKHDTHNCHFYNALKKYGVENFTWKIEAECEDEITLNNLEKKFIKEYQEKGILLYNKKEGGDGGSFSEETKKKLSDSHKGLRKGWKHTPETIFKMKQVKRTKKHKQAIIESNKNRIYSEETKKKIGLAQKGKTISEENKKLISLANKGKKLSDETKKKISLAKKNKKITEFVINKQLITKGNKPFHVFNVKTGEFLGEFLNQTDCARKLFINRDSIRRGLKLLVVRPRKYVFKYIV